MCCACSLSWQQQFNTLDSLHSLFFCHEAFSISARQTNKLSSVNREKILHNSKCFLSRSGASYSPEYYINIRTGIHYFPKGNATIDRFKSGLNRIEEKHDEVSIGKKRLSRPQISIIYLAVFYCCLLGFRDGGLFVRCVTMFVTTLIKIWWISWNFFCKLKCLTAKSNYSNIPLNVTSFAYKPQTQNLLPNFFNATLYQKHPKRVF